MDQNALSTQNPIKFEDGTKQLVENCTRDARMNRITILSQSFQQIYSSKIRFSRVNAKAKQNTLNGNKFFSQLH